MFPASSGVVRVGVWAAALFVGSSVGAATYHVSPGGRSQADGGPESPFSGLAEAVERARPGDVIRVAAGLYRSEQPIRLRADGTAEAPIRVEAADGARPIFDFSAQEFSKRSSGLVVEGDYWRLTGLEVMGAARNGFEVTGDHNIIERCIARENQDSGFQLNAPASHNVILDCDSFRNVDRPTLGENADGFGAKFQIGPGNVFRGCRAWENADDGFDLWKAPHPVRIEKCVAFRNGIDVWGIPGYTGNGNGFKLGGDFIAASHVVVDCVAVEQPRRGFDQNNNMGALTVERCTAMHCGTGFLFQRTTTDGRNHVLRENLSWDAPVRYVVGTLDERNRWLNADGSPAPPKVGEPTPPGEPKQKLKKPVGAS